jgi:hypothetical protein
VIGELLCVVGTFAICAGDADSDAAVQLALSLGGSSNGGRGLSTAAAVCGSFLSATLAVADAVLKTRGIGDAALVFAEHCVAPVATELVHDVGPAALQTLGTSLLHSPAACALAAITDVVEAAVAAIGGESADDFAGQRWTAEAVNLQIRGLSSAFFAWSSAFAAEVESNVRSPGESRLAAADRSPPPSGRPAPIVRQSANSQT